ncbi:MAG: XRE family transcriptional regulator [Dehalococcoidia bacterium]|nr:MAG: XRE family transcriptional regulator [Dehalococcoidia bacterium]
MTLEIRRRPYRRYRHVQAEIVRKGRVQGDVARQIGITPQHFSAVLNGYEPMTDRLAREIAFALGIKLEFVLSQDGEKGA